MPSVLTISLVMSTVRVTVVWVQAADATKAAARKENKCFIENRLFDWCKKDTLYKSNGIGDEIDAALPPKMRHFMHRLLTTLFVSLDGHLIRWLVLGTITLGPMAGVGQSSIDPPGWWGNLESGRVEVLASDPEWEAIERVECGELDVTVVGWREAALPGHVWINMDISQVQEERDIELTITTDQGQLLSLIHI